MIALCFISLSGNGQTVKINDILDSIAKNNPSLKGFDVNIRSLEAASKGARNWMPPEISTGFWMTPYNIKYWKGSNGNFGIGQYMISGMQTFPNKKKQDAEEQYLKSFALPERLNKQYQANALFAEAKTNFYEWIILKKKWAILNENEKMFNFMIKDAEIRYKNGLEKISAYYKAQAALGNIKNLELITESNINRRRIILNNLMNHDPASVFEIDSTYNINAEMDAAFDTTALMNQRSDISAIDRQIKINQFQINFENAKLKPEYGLRYDHMFGFGGLPAQFTLMATVKLPMARWASQSSKANIESIQLKTEAMKLQQKTLVNEAFGQIFNLQNDIILKREQIKLYESKIIPALQKSYQTIQLAYGQNTESLFSLFDAWQTLNMTQFEYLSLLQELLTKKVELEKTIEKK